jgi:hypothetical protein
VALGTWSFLAYQREQADQRREAAQHDPERTEQQPTDPCIRRSGPIDSINCLIREANAQREDKRAEYDLQARQDMAAWGYGVLLVSVAGLGATVFGVWLIWLNLREARKVTSQAVETTKAATSQVELSRKALEVAHRPWIKFDAAFVRYYEADNDDQVIVIKPTYTNIGKSPAIDVRLHQIKLAEGGSDKLSWNKVDAVVKDVEADGLFSVGVVVYPADSHPDAHYNFAVRTSKSGSVAWATLAGVITYRYAESRVYRTPFAFHATVELADGQASSPKGSLSRVVVDLYPT